MMTSKSLTAVAATLLCLLSASTAWAHKPSDSYLSVQRQGNQVTGEWDIALRDLELAIGLDADQDGAITWGELRARHSAIANYALARLDLTAGGEACVLNATDHLVDRHSDGAYSVLRFAAQCPSTEALALDYRLFFDLDPTHRGLLKVDLGDAVRTAVLSPDSARLDLSPEGLGLWPQFVEFWREGVWHIWIGFDHILFLLTLLMAAVLRREAREWQSVESFRPVLLQVAGIVTAFTVAHSLTLMAAIFGWVSLPSRWVETAIAATVVLAAVNNLVPILPGKRWVVAFVLGLIHGFGFAGVLVDLGLPGSALALALVGFNLGVEVGQLAIVALFLPIAYCLRDSWFYRRVVFIGGSLAIAALAAVWLLERGLDVSLLSI
ncbi:MAG: HupE/UreJ family protein [Acidobacteriota bacterium]